MYDVFVYVDDNKYDSFEYIKQGCRGMKTYSGKKCITVLDDFSSNPIIFVFDDVDFYGEQSVIEDENDDDLDYFDDDDLYMPDPDRQGSCLRFHLSQDHVYPDIVPARYEIENEYYPDIIKIKDCAEINNIVDFFTKSSAPDEYPNWIKKHIV